MSDTPRNKLSLKRGESAEASDSPKLTERLHKVLAQAGLGSRRALEQRIADGLVKVNGEVAQTGLSVKGGDRIELDGKTFVASALTEPARVLLYNKPEGEVTTREDPEGRPTIFEALPALKGARWIAIGRLDINTTGLLVLTTDGELANAMMHPSYEVEREYVCRVRAPEGMETVPDNLVDRLARGVALEDGPAKFDVIERIGGTDSHDWFRVVVKEGRNREVRRLWESQGCQVSRLKRTRYGKISLPQPLLRGQSQELPDVQVEKLRSELGLETGAPPALTLQPVIGQRKAAKATVHLGAGRGAGQAYVNGHNTADEGRELRRFDHVREDRGRGRGKKPHGGLTVSGEAAAKQSQKPFKSRPTKGPKPLPDGNPAAFRSWYVPDGVDTGPTGHRNAGPPKPYGKKPAGPRPAGAGRPGPGGNRPYAARSEGNFGNETRGPRGPGPKGPRPGGQGQGDGPQRAPRPYGHPGNAPSFPSDHANPGAYNPYGQQPRAPRPQGARPGGNRPGGNGPRPGNNGPRPSGPRGAGRPPGGGNRGPRGGNHG
ncbi:MAG: rRNA pseudouridine synthase [Lysobacteraceae bacterium]|nr:MAG: rRNA pseudouridine synthase [Xanthomonadaceae bacterium]